MDRGGTTDAALAALAEPTRRRVYELVAASAEPIGRDGVAAGLGIGRPLAAFHLEKLVAAGLLAPEFRRLSGRTGPGAGRPAKLYRRSPSDLELSVPPRRYGRAAELFAEALAGADDARLQAIARERGRGAGTSARMGGAAWVEALSDAGYAPATDAGSGDVWLRNCPYADLARDHRDVMCPANQAFLEGFAGGFDRPDAVTLHLDRPDGGCCVRFETAPRQDGVSQTG